MDLELNRLHAVETPIRGEVRLADPDGSLAREGIRFPDPFHVEGSARLTRGLVLVTGRATGTLEMECGRCLSRLRQPVDLTFEARFAPASAAPKASPARAAPSSPSSAGAAAGSGRKAASGHVQWTEDDEDGIRLEREDLDVSFLPAGTTVLRIDDVVREQVLLEVPLRPLCRPDCQGLCARCGADLNEADCGCPPEETHDLRLAALADIKKKLEQGDGATGTSGSRRAGAPGKRPDKLPEKN